MAAALAVVYVVWGSTYVAMKVAVSELPPLSLSAIRFLAAGALVYGWCAWQRSRHVERGWRAPTMAQWRVGAILGIALPAAGTGGATWAEQRLPASTVALVLATVPVWMTVADRITGGERISVWTAIGLTVGVIGVAVLVNPLAAPPDGDRRRARRCDELGAGLVYAQRAPHPDQPLIAGSMQMISGGLVLGILALVTGEWSQVHLREAVTTSGAAVLYLIVAGSLLAYSAYEWLLGHVSGRVAGTYAFVNPVVAVLLAWWLLSERIDARTGIAVCVIVAGVVLLVATSKTGSADEADGIDAVKVESPNAGRVRSIP